MRSFLFLVLLGLGLPAMSASDFHGLYEVIPDEGTAYELGWVKEGLAMRQDGKVSKALNLDCQADLDEEMKLTEQQQSIEGSKYHCRYEGTMENSEVGMSLERSCKLLYNSAFFEVICQEDYSGGAHPDAGVSYYYLDKDAVLVPEDAFAALLAQANPQSADFQKQSAAMQKSCSDWFVEQGDVFSKDELESLLGTATAQRAGVTKEGAPLIGMAYYLARVARANPCDQKTFWVRLQNDQAWKGLSIKGQVKAIKNQP